MERKDYLTTGELTQLMGITKHTLFHYDDIGLFQPKYINEKGYRFYSIDQIDILNTILVLRDLDMPLKEIQTYVSQRTPELFQQIFLEHEAQIAKQIKKTTIHEKMDAATEKQDSDCGTDRFFKN